MKNKKVICLITIMFMVFFMAAHVLAQTEPLENVNDRLTFIPISQSFSFSADNTGCPAGFAGIFSFKAKLAKDTDV